MIISHKHKFIYVKLAKVGGTSVELSLRPHLPARSVIRGAEQHGNRKAVIKRVGQQKWDDYTKVISIRNPWDALVSYYFYSWQVDKHPRASLWHRTNPDQQRPRNRTFPEFMSWMVHRSSYILNTEYHLGQGWWDYCIRYENIDEDFRGLCELLDLPTIELQKRTVSHNRNSVHYSYFYNDHLKSLVAKMYKPQINAFGYTFELPSTPPVRAYVGGTFDLFHLGHVNLFKNTKKHVDEVIVAVNGDEFAETYKRKPILNEDVRLELVRSCKYVDNAFLIKTGVDQPHRIRAVGVKYIVHGDDWTGDSLCEQLCITDEWMKQKNIEFLYLPYTQGICTSDIIKEVQNSNGK